MSAKQIISKQRVADHGEVFTAPREVNAMLDLVKNECQRIESRFLEPACGTGNFLAEVLRRKLEIVKSRYKESSTEFEKYALLALSSIYGIDILGDSVTACRQRLFDVFCKFYSEVFQNNCPEKCQKVVVFILSLNIVWGDALSFKQENGTPIVFAEWSLVNDVMIKRRDFAFKNMLTQASINSLPMFAMLAQEEKEVCIPTPVREYPLTHYLEIAHE